MKQERSQSRRKQEVIYQVNQTKELVPAYCVPSRHAVDINRLMPAIMSSKILYSLSKKLLQSWYPDAATSCLYQHDISKMEEIQLYIKHQLHYDGA